MLLITGCARPPAEKPALTPAPPLPTSVPSIPPPLPLPSPIPSPPPVSTPGPTPSASLLKIDANGERASYRSDDVNVSGYFYRPEGAGPFPAVLVLHDSNGLGEKPRAYAAWLASQGYVALAPDYLTPIGVPKEKWSLSDWTKNLLRISKYLGDGVEAIKTLPYVIPNQIAVVGFSLGGYFAFILAGRDDVKGIVSYYGAYVNVGEFSGIVAQIRAPVLMLHGDVDQIVPIASANAVQNLLASSNKQFEYITYPGAGHGLDIQGGPNYNAAAAADAQQKTLAFLRAKLR